MAFVELVVAMIEEEDPTRLERRSKSRKSEGVGVGLRLWCRVSGMERSRRSEDDLRVWELALEEILRFSGSGLGPGSVWDPSFNGLVQVDIRLEEK